MTAKLCKTASKPHYVLPVIDACSERWEIGRSDRPPCCAVAGGASEDMADGQYRPAANPLIPHDSTHAGRFAQLRGHRALEAGGIGFITGDGRLNYAPEWVTELYYDARVAPGLNVALNYQFVVNPAYNADRGPVNVFGLRTRIAF